ncbi:response regulator [Fibrisoma montanum]|uniref:histidine kinase n=1 Tax=Fibrisoma montanum TaxID=2305895 RepID=A0A418LZR8_9BACT|nr:ATP-binding protein [Fibrisoma montanum]RIV18714.1 response regulator [Fibrisoma montanum]
MDTPGPQTEALLSVYRTAFKHSLQSFCLLEKIDNPVGTATDFRFLLTTSAFEQQLGIHQPEGKTIRQLVPPVEPQLFEHYERVALTGQPTHFEHYVAALDCWMAVSVFRVKQEAPYWIGALFDNITQRKKAENQQAYLLTLSDALRPLADAEQIQRAALHCLGQHLQVDRVLYAEVEPDEAHFVISANYVQPPFPQMIGCFQLSDFGKTPDSQRLGQTLVLADIHQVDESDEHLRSYLAAGVVSIIGIPLRKGGRWVASLTVHHGQPRQWTAQEVALVEETAERTWAALERARAEQALREEDRRKDEFMAMLGHELRNPLAVVTNTLLLLELTQGADSSLSYDKAVRLMSRETRHLKRMVDDLLDVGRIRQGKIKLERKRIDLGELVGQTVEGAQPLYQESNRQLLAHLPFEPLYVEGDTTRLAQVVMNLLTNGAKYTLEGGHVWVSLEAQGPNALLRVKDDGIGIPEEEQAAIFEVFVQGNTSLDRPQGGLGLGLAVVKQLVQGHGGSVAVYSAGPGQGSEFRIELPLTRVSAPPAQRPAQTLSGSSRGRVLVVDDNKDLADMTARLVEMNGYEVHVRYGGPEGLEAAESLRPEVILLDIGMPTLDGYAVSRRIRSQPWGDHITIVAITGFGQEADMQRSRAAGFDEHLLKPVDYSLLLEVLARSIPGGHTA